MRRKLLNGSIVAVLAVLLVLFMAVGVAEEERTDASGQWKYVLGDGGATITEYVNEPHGDLVIPGELDGYHVINIGFAAFEMSQGLTGVVIPEGVTSIGIAAFNYCENLTGVTIPDGVINIGDSAFYYCFGLTDVATPISVTRIGYGAFEGCKSLAGVTIPASVTDIGEDAFSECGEIVLSVAEGSYAEQYAKENEIPYVYCAPVFTEDAEIRQDETRETGEADAILARDVDDTTTAFEDGIFLLKVYRILGKDENEPLAVSEVAELTELNVAFCGIESLCGIEHFSALKSLDCSSNDLSSLDVQFCTLLEKLDCSGNFLTSLDVTSNPKLTTLACADMSLTSFIGLSNEKRIPRRVRMSI